MILYPRMALQNIKKNSRFFIPRILTEAGLFGCFYIVYTLYCDERLRSVYGGQYLPFFMLIGIVVTLLLSVILMLYTNSFLMKQRTQELGLYNILGLEKRHVGKILFFESAVSSLSGIILGSILGMLFYKISTLFICRLLRVESILGFYYIKADTILRSALVFVVIDLLTYFINLIKLARMKPVELLANAHTGEKEPKVKWVMLLVGIITLGLGYILAVLPRSPLGVIITFFLAVLLVIIGTYCLFVTGTIFVLKRLKNNKKYYYNKKHMTSVSGLLYRMKQNAVGLASICILSTGVLVAISTTVSLYSGTEKMLDTMYKQDLYLYAEYQLEDESYRQLDGEVLVQSVEKAAKENKLEIKEIKNQNFMDALYKYEDEKLITVEDLGSFKNLVDITFITEAGYKELTGKSLGLKKNEMAFCTINLGQDILKANTNLKIGNQTFMLTRQLNFFPISPSTLSVFSSLGIVAADESVINSLCADNEKMSQFVERLSVSFKERKLPVEIGEKFKSSLISKIKKAIQEQRDYKEKADISIQTDFRWEAERDFYGMYGTFLFLGILLGLIFLFATALIIYYKQISEGYEDRKRFQIMEKIGMSQSEVKGSIRSQILLVFFLPLLAAGIHICFAFPLLKQLLDFLLLSTTTLFIVCALITFVIFALVYVVIYSITAKTYYKIVH